MKITSYKLMHGEDERLVLLTDKVAETKHEHMLYPEAYVETAEDLFHFRRAAEEYAYVICVNTKGKPVGAFELSHGTVNQSICNVREIFIRALMCGATAFAVLHNHPSNVLDPSNADIEVAKGIAQAAKFMNLDFNDFIIVGRTNYYSFRESKIL